VSGIGNVDAVVNDDAVCDVALVFLNRKVIYVLYCPFLNNGSDRPEEVSVEDPPLLRRSRPAEFPVEWLLINDASLYLTRSSRMLAIVHRD
jgi:hypothetical protein